MVLQCYVWIHHLLKQILGDLNDVTKPEDTVSTKSPAKDTSQLSAVGENWRVLTSSSNYKLHESRDGPLILRYITYEDNQSISIIDGSSEKEFKVRGLKEFEKAEVVSCCNGLVLLTSSSPAYLHIVLSKERTTIILSPMMWHGRPCGFFYNPIAKEYRILTVLKTETSTEKEPSYEYRLYLFGDKIWRRTMTPYFHLQPSHRYMHGPKEWINGNPAIVNGALHWLMNGIMVFDMTAEKFSVKRLPYGVYNGERYYNMRDLMVKEDSLCFFHLGSRETVMAVWIMEDYEKWSWVRKYSVNLDWNILEYPMERSRSQIPKLSGVRVVAIGKDELVMFWKDRGLFSYYLASNTVLAIPLRKSKIDSVDFSINYGRECGFMAYSTPLQQ